MVTDNTAEAFPGSGQENLTDVASGTIEVYEIDVSDLCARIKHKKCKLTWTHTGADEYEILRSEKGPNESFELIGTTDSTYSGFLDKSIISRKDYWYRIQTGHDGEMFLSPVVHVYSKGCR